MKILFVNKFFYLKGGSEHVFFETAALLKQKGHDVMFFSMRHPKNIRSEYEKYFISTVDYEKKGIINQIGVSLKLLYSIEAKRKIEALIETERPDIAHLHNIHHQISPSILHSLRKFNIPVVLTLHDYKMACASYSMLACGEICEACGGGRYYNCFLKGCVKNSRLKSLLNTLEIYLHQKILHIYNLVDVFIAPSRFLKGKLEEMGFKGKIAFLPNFVDCKTSDFKLGYGERSIVYFGRLSGEKGLHTLIDAVKDIDGVLLKIIGEGPLKERLKLEIMKKGIRNVEFLGYKTGEDLKNAIRQSMFFVLPSECYENNPLSIIEGFALGKPGIGARIGGIPELIKDNKTGFTFESGSASDLRLKIRLLAGDMGKINEMGRRARSFVEEEFSPEKYYAGLMNIYGGLVGGNCEL